MGSLEQRLGRLEKAPASVPVEKETLPHTLEQVAYWWAQRYNWRRAAMTLGISESETIERWGDESGWLALQEQIDALDEQAKVLCEESYV